jgi:hypothetical protein
LLLALPWSADRLFPLHCPVMIWALLTMRTAGSIGTQESICWHCCVRLGRTSAAARVVGDRTLSMQVARLLDPYSQNALSSGPKRHRILDPPDNLEGYVSINPAKAILVRYDWNP